MEEQLKEISQEMACGNCGATLKFMPGTNHQKCEYCSHVNEIVVAGKEAIAELELEAYLGKAQQASEKIEITTVKCTACGAQSTLKPNVTSDDCAFCGTSLVLKNGTTCSILKPKSVLPFKIDQKVAFANFTTWVKGLWFAPNKLKSCIQNVEKLKGIYIPYWTFDSNTDTSYYGERGVNRYVTENYTTVENGRTVHRTRTRTVTDWYPASGNVSNTFDDVLVNASRSLPLEYMEKLEPWDLENLMPFDEKFLSGFRSESYQVALEEGFTVTKNKMEPRIEQTILSDIGGDHQRISSKD
ncbi:MAG: hypothetical protein EOP48_31415, partial [Sphingobacteriales bacterium]